MGNRQVSVREAQASDLAAVLRVQHDAFGRVAEEYGIPADALPPLRETAEDLGRLMTVGTRFWVACDAEGTVLGSVRGTDQEGVIEIGRLVVASGHQRKGVATALMDALESSYPGAARFVLFTGKDASAPLALYSGRGDRLNREDREGPVPLVWLEKTALP